MKILSLLFTSSKSLSSIESDLESMEGLLLPWLVSLVGAIALLSLL